MNSASSRRLFTLILGLAILLGCLLLIADALRTRNSTGLLRVNSPDKNATLSISQVSTDAKFIGIGNSKIRLAAGDYLLAASDHGRLAYSSVTIINKQTTTTSIDPAKASTLPSTGGVNFTGFDGLINSGLSTGQVSRIKEDLFAYKTSEKTVVLDRSSIKPAPHNPDVDTSFRLSFKLTIDSASYSATASYSDLSSVHLQLFDQQGTVVYTSQP